jgi:hypothetical protein
MSQNRLVVNQSLDVAPPSKRISQSGEVHPAPNARSTKCHVTQRCAAKERVSRLARPKVLRIQQRYISGENQTAIAKAEGCDRETVSRIVKSSEMTEYVERMKEEFRGFVPDALIALRHALQVQKDPRIAYQVLRDVGVVLPRQLQVQLAEASVAKPEDELRREWATKFGLMVLQKHEVYGASLPDVGELVD